MSDVLTCLVKDDFTNLVLLYRKLVNLEVDAVGLYTAYNRKNQKFVFNKDLFKIFPKLTYLGPTPIYENYVSMANFPYTIDLRDYFGDEINVDIVDHLQKRHIDEIFPKQKTAYVHNLHVESELFKNVIEEINTKDIIIPINLYDPEYDKNISLQYDLGFCVNKIKTIFNDRNVKIYVIGVIHEGFHKFVFESICDLMNTEDVEVINWLDRSLSEQIALLLNCTLFVSGAFGLGFLAYSLGIPTLVIYNYFKQDLKGKTINLQKENKWYMEITDEEIFSRVDDIMLLVKERLNDRNRNSNA